MDERGTVTPRGRRAGTSQTRDTILRVALEQFAADGFGNTSIRSIATAANVDPSLVTHFFGTKDDLFVAALGVLDTLPARMSAAFSGKPELLPRRLTETYLGLWDDPATGMQLRAIYRSTSTSRAAATLVQGVLASRLTPDALRNLTPEQLTKLPIVISQLVGAAISRYVFALTPLVAMSLTEFIDQLEPAIAATLNPHQI